MPIGDGATWDETKPDNDTSLTDGDDYQRDMRVGTRGRMALEHVWPSSQTGTAEAGYHKYITFQPGTTLPATLILGTTAGALTVASSGTGYEAYVATVESGTTASGNIQVTFLSGLNLGAGHMASQTVGGMIYSTGSATAGFAQVAIGTTGDILYSVDGTAPGWSNTLPAALTFSEDISFAKNITVNTAATVGALSCTGTATMTGNVVMVASASIGGAATVTGALAAPEQFGSWLSRSFATDYEAASDGFVVAWIYSTAGADLIMKGYTDSNATPTTEIARYQNRTIGDDTGGTITFPVKKGDYWRVDKSNEQTSSLYWLPLGA